MSKLQGTLEFNSYLSHIACEEMQPTEAGAMADGLQPWSSWGSPALLVFLIT